MGQLWEELLTPEIITRGWHMARSDVRQDFAQDLFSTDSYGQFLKQNVHETINRLRTSTYQARPLFRIEVPKGALGFRPGSVLPIQDRVVLSAIVLLLAPRADKQLSASVYSWRLKNPLPKKGPIFRENDITDLPFLKKSTIRERVDPFEGWYLLWPEFDKETRRLYEKDGYRYLATSDIAAYFENIQLPILRDQLIQLFSDEAELVNLLCHFFETWTDRTPDGRPHHRGIPQGNFISSFLGNIFLKPLDDEMTRLGRQIGIAYYRYMDDVRVFSKDHDAARKSILIMARKLRELHLNVQSAKTKIYDERQGEIRHLLIDERADKISALIDNVKAKYGDRPPPKAEKVRLSARLNDIAREYPEAGQRIVGARKPLDGLSLRVFMRWMTAHAQIGSDYYVDRLLAEMRNSADAKLTRKLVTTTKRFPRRRGIERAVRKMIASGELIFPHQEAECLRAVRYLSFVTNEMYDLAWRRVRNDAADRYLRMQAAYLLSRTLLTRRRISALRTLFWNEPDPFVQVAIATILVQSPNSNREIVRATLLHPNEKVREIGKLFQIAKNDESLVNSTLKHALNPKIPWATCDYMPLVHLAAQSESAAIRYQVTKALRLPRKNHPIVGVRVVLSHIYTNLRLPSERCGPTS